MRLTTFLLIVALTQLSAKSFSQISLNAKDEPLEQVFKSIRQQTGYTFIYESDALPHQKVTVTVSNASLATALSECFKDLSLTYQVVGKNVVIEPEKSSIIRNITDLFRPADIRIYGNVVDENGKVLPNATIKIKGDSSTTPIIAGETGGFSMIIKGNSAILIVSYVGYKTKEVTVSGADVELVIKLEPLSGQLNAVNIFSTGYQQLPKERATGSFEVIDNKTLNQVTGKDILTRLVGNATGLNINAQLMPASSGNPVKHGVISNLTIRGANSINSGLQFGSLPLVVVDGVALEDNGAAYIFYGLDEDVPGKINPNDVESITLLKDAAAASIWGSRAANGVIVITTKKGKYNQPMRVDFNSNVTVTDKPDLFYYKHAATSDFVGMQKFLYNNGYYDGTLSYSQFAQYGYPLYAVPQTVEILEQQKSGQITSDQANAQLAELSNNDIRKDITRYILRNAVNQQYSVAVSAGSQQLAYRLAAGYDNNLNNTITSGEKRLTLNSGATIRPAKNLDIETTISYAQDESHDQSINSYFNESGNTSHYENLLPPYTRLADSHGNPLPVIRDYRPGYIDTAGEGHLLPWNYVPLQDLRENYAKTSQSGLNLNLKANYKWNDALSAQIIYSYQKLTTDFNQLDGADSYFMRDLINKYTSPPAFVDPTGQPYVRSIPTGGMYTAIHTDLSAQMLRGQLNFDKTWNKKNVINAIAGSEVRSSYSPITDNLYFGYNPATLRYTYQLNYLDYVPYYFGGSTQLPYPTPTTFSDNRQRSVSEFANAAYTYDRRYVISASVRKDASNVFGVETNHNFSPFYSIGGRWNINNERFFKIHWISTLQLRGSFGYNGNVNYFVPPVALLNFSNTVAPNNQTYASASGGTNNLLSPERSGILNIGLDFALLNRRISGSIEYYHKNNNNLISNAPLDPSTGFVSLFRNAADIKGKGMDMTINSANIVGRRFSWSSNFLFSYNRTNVQKLFYAGTTTSYSVILGQHIAGYDLNGLWAYKWAGLSNTGEPKVYLNGKESTDYQDIAFSEPYKNTMQFMGSATPVYFGSLRNTFRYGNITLSANIRYEMGYVFRNPMAINYTGTYNGNNYLSPEFEQRWQNPGDELHTNVPAMTYPNDQNSDIIYDNATINVLKGDNIRLQEINFSYTFKMRGRLFKDLSVYGNIQNVGILWRANKLGLDPDVYDVPQPRSYALGLRASF